MKYVNWFLKPTSFWYIIAGLSFLGWLTSFNSEEIVYHYSEAILFFVSIGFVDILKILEQKDD